MTPSPKTAVSQKGNAEKREVPVVEIVRVGDKMIIPEQITYYQAIDLLKIKAEHEETLVAVDETFPVFPWDGALATHKALIEIFGIAVTQSTYSFFGKQPPAEKGIDIGVNQKTTVPWGKLMWPLQEKDNPTDEFMFTEVAEVRGHVRFRLAAQIKRKWLGEWRKVCETIHRICREESIYRSKAIRLAFTDSDGDLIALPEPEFMDLSHVHLEDIVYSRSTEQIIQSYVMAPLYHTQACREDQIPLKRGVLAAGPFGTGKSLLALAVGKVGTENGWTFLYIKNAKELPYAIRFAKQYQPCVIFAEDLDRATSGVMRTEEIDEILNTLDGIDTKGDEIMVVLTTNDLSAISPAMRRPGRLDVVINVLPPDADAAQRLVRVYGRGLIAENADLSRVGELLQGATPAVIRETVERAKLATIMRTAKSKSIIEATDLEISAQAMKEQQALLSPTRDENQNPAREFIAAVADEVQHRFDDGVGKDVRRGMRALGVSI